MNLFPSCFASALVACLLSGSGVLGADVTPKAVLIFSRPPASYPEAIDFVTLTKRNVAYSQLVRPSGEQVEIPNGGEIAIIEHPPSQPDAETPQRATKALNQIQTVLAKFSRAQYPQIHNKLNPMAAKWRAVQAMKVPNLVLSAPSYSVPATRTAATSTTAPAQGEETPAPPQVGPTIATQDGHKYENVTVTTVGTETLSFTHAAGTATIPLSDLIPELQRKYNCDSTRVEAAKRAKEQAAAAVHLFPVQATPPEPELDERPFWSRRPLMTVAGILILLLLVVIFVASPTKVPCPRCQSSVVANVLSREFISRPLAHQTITRHDRTRATTASGSIDNTKPGYVTERQEQVVVPVDTFKLELQCPECNHTWELIREE